jgi:hypothetical protein
VRVALVIPFPEGLVADNIDLPDGRHLTLYNVGGSNPVTLSGVTVVILTAYLPQQNTAASICSAPSKDLSNTLDSDRPAFQTSLAFPGEFLGAVISTWQSRTLLQRHNQHVVLLPANIFEESCRVQGLDCS